MDFAQAFAPGAELLQQLWEETPDAVFLVAQDARVVLWNRAAVDIFGYRYDEAIGQRIDDLIVPADAVAEDVRFRDQALQHGLTVFETVRRRKDGTRIQVSVSNKPIRAAQAAPLVMSIAKDITHLKSVTALMAIEEANRLKSEFLANMSHELRTPLNGIIGFSEFMIGGGPGPLTQKQREYLTDILDSGHRLLQTVNDVLDLSKLEAGCMRLRTERFLLTSAVDEVCAGIEAMAKPKSIRLERLIAACLSEVTLDRHRFEQVLYNLLSNAVKFTGNGGEVRLVIEPLGADCVQVHVQDSGIGIRAEDFPKLFVAFRQLDSGSTRRYGGTGVGLALTKRIVELQNGTVSVASVPGGGSTFTVILPLGASA